MFQAPENFDSFDYYLSPSLPLKYIRKKKTKQNEKLIAVEVEKVFDENDEASFT